MGNRIVIVRITDFLSYTTILITFLCNPKICINKNLSLYFIYIKLKIITCILLYYVNPDFVTLTL